MVKLILYILIIPLVVFLMVIVNINGIFKKGQSNYYQARFFYMMLVMSISYLVVSFIMDFLGDFKIDYY